MSQETISMGTSQMEEAEDCSKFLSNLSINTIENKKELQVETKTSKRTLNARKQLHSKKIGQRRRFTNKTHNIRKNNMQDTKNSKVTCKLKKNIKLLKVRSNCKTKNKLTASMKITSNTIPYKTKYGLKKKKVVSKEITINEMQSEASVLNNQHQASFKKNIYMENCTKTTHSKYDQVYQNLYYKDLTLEKVIEAIENCEYNIFHDEEN